VVLYQSIQEEVLLDSIRIGDNHVTDGDGCGELLLLNQARPVFPAATALFDVAVVVNRLGLRKLCLLRELDCFWHWELGNLISQQLTQKLVKVRTVVSIKCGAKRPHER